MAKKNLPYVRIVAINADLIKWVELAKTPYISGGGLYIIYKNNGVESPFDEAKQYQIFTKEGNYALVCEVTKNLVA
jgi:hypothetical protein